jgi:uncharacterized membrane protein YhhN
MTTTTTGTVVSRGVRKSLLIAAVGFGIIVLAFVVEPLDTDEQGWPGLVFILGAIVMAAGALRLLFFGIVVASRAGVHAARDE